MTTEAQTKDDRLALAKESERVRERRPQQARTREQIKQDIETS